MAPAVKPRIPGRPFLSYQLILSVNKQITLQVGRLGRFKFPVGTYVYTGSARRNMGKRIERHHRKSKPLRWHIDYLLRHPSVEILHVRHSRKKECTLNRETPGEITVKGFGSSDCRGGCGSHLKYQGPTGKDPEGAPNRAPEHTGPGP